MIATQDVQAPHRVTYRLERINYTKFESWKPQLQVDRHSYHKGEVLASLQVLVMPNGQ